VKALLNAAAQARHTTVSDFLLNHGIQAAEDAIIPRIVYVSEEGWETVQKLLNEPEDIVPDEAAVAWLTKPRLAP
jgi:uncharacterized protein (DUF1778 family)